MDAHQMLETLSPDVERQLDLLLANWGQARQLDGVQGEAMRQEILQLAAELPSEWWLTYWQQLNGAFERANQVQKNLISTLQRQRLSHLSNQIGWAPRNADQWQSYLQVV